MNKRFIKDRYKLCNMARTSLNPREVMEKLALFMGNEYGLTSDKIGYRILRKTEANGNGITGQVIFGSRYVNVDKRWGLHIFNPDQTEKVEDFLRKQGIHGDISRYPDCSSLTIPAILYDDLPTPELGGLSSQIFNTHLDTNNVSVQTTNFTKNMIYFYNQSI